MCTLGYRAISTLYKFISRAFDFYRELRVSHSLRRIEKMRKRKKEKRETNIGQPLQDWAEDKERNGSVELDL